MKLGIQQVQACTR